MPTNALHSLIKNGGGSGSFKLRNRKSSSKDHTHQILLTRSNSVPPPPQSPSPTSPSSPPIPTSPTQLVPPQPLFPSAGTGSTTPVGGGTLRRSSHAGSLTSIPETAALQDALQEAAEKLAKKSDYNHASLSSTSSSVLSETGAVVTVLEGEEVFSIYQISTMVKRARGEKFVWVKDGNSPRV